MAELHDLTGLEQAEAIREGTVSPVELTEHYLDRIDRLNETVGAYITVTPEIARKQAAQAESEALAARREERRLPPLHGVPVPVKDLNFVAGVRCTLGSSAYADHVPDVDDHVVTRLRTAGTILLGKTNTPEFGLPCYTENRLAPPARTPWDLEYSAGGSSGGAAAAVASGLAPLAHGSDGGGSIRIPASVCGLYGIKPSRGRVSSGPVLYDVSGLSSSGPLARSVADAAALLDAMAGVMPGVPYAAPALPPGESFASHAQREPGRLRVVALPQPPVPGVELHADCRAAYEDAAELLRELGHEVDEIDLPVDNSIRDAFVTVWRVMARIHPVAPEHEESLMPLTRHLRSEADAVAGSGFAEALYAFRALGQLVADALLSTYDVILTPTLAQPPARVGGLRDDADPGAEFAGLAAFTPFTPLYNATGQPSVSVPLYWNAAGLPIGVMFGGRYGDEATLVSLSAQLEAARPWAGRRPAVW
ncbi:amidase [Streptomyces sp. RB6PN25]|uniref:Amidase n=1 Tax=Streptomyces humicola TaxID=2953240 RepID=A0ABT1PQT0_9ACTN|nr:amidase [Streptomyces humicola]MCQ4080027.1 amidase [Streptomyces humicola]